MPLRAPWSRSKPAPEPAPHAGYFALHDAFGDEGASDDRFDDWNRPGAGNEPPHGRWLGRRRRWWSRPIVVNPVAAAATATGLLALGALIGALAD